MSVAPEGESLFKKFADRLPVPVRVALSVAFLGLLLTACGTSVEAQGVKIETGGNDVVVGIEIDPAIQSGFDMSSSPYLRDRGVVVPTNLFVQAMTGDDVEKLCDRKHDLPGVIGGCLVSDGDKYLAIVENVGGPRQKMLTTHEVIHATLLEQAKNDMSMNDLSQGDLELLVRDFVLKDALYRVVQDNGLDPSNPAQISEALRQIEIVAASGSPSSESGQYFYESLRLAGGVSLTSDSMDLAHVMLNYSIDDLANAQTGLSRSYFGSSLFMSEEYHKLIAYLTANSPFGSYETLIMNYETPKVAR